MCFRCSCISGVCACVQKKFLLIRNKVLSLQPEIRLVNPKIWLRESQRVEYLWGIFGIAKGVGKIIRGALEGDVTKIAKGAA